VFDGDIETYSIEIEYDIIVDDRDKRLIVDVIELVPNTIWRALRIAGQSHDEVLNLIKRYGEPDKVNWSPLTVDDTGQHYITARVANSEKLIKWDRRLPNYHQGKPMYVLSLPAMASGGSIALFHQSESEIICLYDASVKNGRVNLDIVYRLSDKYNVDAAIRFLYVLCIRHIFWLDQWLVRRALKRDEI
jgi:hypothetical protein